MTQEKLNVAAIKKEQAKGIIIKIIKHEVTAGDFRKLINYSLTSLDNNVDSPLNADGTTALMLASQYGEKNMVEWLLTKGANPKSHDKNGKNAFDYASKGTADPQKKAVIISQLNAAVENLHSQTQTTQPSVASTSLPSSSSSSPSSSSGSAASTTVTASLTSQTSEVKPLDLPTMELIYAQRNLIDERKLISGWKKGAYGVAFLDLMPPSLLQFFYTDHPYNMLISQIRSNTTQDQDSLNNRKQEILKHLVRLYSGLNITEDELTRANVVTPVLSTGKNYWRLQLDHGKFFSLLGKKLEERREQEAKKTATATAIAVAASSTSATTALATKQPLVQCFAHPNLAKEAMNKAELKKTTLFWGFTKIPCLPAPYSSYPFLFVRLRSKTEEARSAPAYATSRHAGKFGLLNHFVGIYRNEADGLIYYNMGSKERWFKDRGHGDLGTQQARKLLVGQEGSLQQGLELNAIPQMIAQELDDKPDVLFVGGPEGVSLSSKAITTSAVTSINNYLGQREGGRTGFSSWVQQVDINQFVASGDMDMVFTDDRYLPFNPYMTKNLAPNTVYYLVKVAPESRGKVGLEMQVPRLAFFMTDKDGNIPSITEDGRAVREFEIRQNSAGQYMIALDESQVEQKLSPEHDVDTAILELKPTTLATGDRVETTGADKWLVAQGSLEQIITRYIKLPAVAHFHRVQVATDLDDKLDLGSRTTFPGVSAPARELPLPPAKGLTAGSSPSSIAIITTTLGTSSSAASATDFWIDRSGRKTKQEEGAESSGQEVIGQALISGIDNNSLTVTDLVVILQDDQSVVEFEDRDGETVLDHAVRMGRAGIVQTLLENKADPNHTNKKGQNALAIALESKITGPEKESITDLLLNAAHSSSLRK